MKVSARNVFKGTISHLQPGAVNAEVSLKLSGGNELVAVVTMESVKSPGLAVGKGEAVVGEGAVGHADDRVQRHPSLGA